MSASLRFLRRRSRGPEADNARGDSADLGWRAPVLVIGPLPPPMMGPAVCTRLVCRAFETGGAQVVHVDTADNRPVFNTGVFDVRNVVLGLLHSAQVAWRAARHPVRLVYIPISQGRWGYARDAVLIAIARFLRRPIVVHLHGANLQAFVKNASRFEQWVVRTTLDWSTVAIASTPGLKNVFDGLVAPERVRVLENAIDDPFPEGVADIQRRRRVRAERDPTPMRLLFIANNFAAKGAATAVRALAEPGLEQATLRMIGTPPEAVAVKTMQLAAELGVTQRIALLGAVTEDVKWAELAAADGFIYPTENDAQPLVIIEAMASGLPIVASTQGGVPDTLQDAGLLIEPRDPPALARAVRALTSDPERRLELGDAARRRFVEQYSPAAYQVRFHRLFDGLMTRTPS